ncbi:MAG: VTT domain-containing protein [Elusimicrobia bacterium]|nr:VTT domain-containing protein [Elusimicrobiota bacterium]
MIGDITGWIMLMLREHGAAMVFVGVIIESIIVPIPSPLIIMGAGALLIEPGLSWGAAFQPIAVKIILPGAVASTVGAFFAYGIAYWGGKPAIERFQGFLGFGYEEVQRLGDRLAGRVALMIFLLRALPVVPLSLISAAAGVLRLPAAGFSAWTFLGSIPRCLVLGYLGYLTRDTYEGLAGSINRVESLVSAAIVAGAMGLILWLRSRMKQA